MGAELVNEDQKVLIDYVKNHIVDWLEEKSILPFPGSRQNLDTQLLERMVRVEEKLEHQNEKFELLIANMDKRFDDINRQFNRQNLYHLATFTAIIGSAVAIILKA